MPLILWCPKCKLYGNPPAGIENISIQSDSVLTPWDKEILIRERNASGVMVAKPSDGKCVECGQPMAVCEGMKL
jgi:hypothetical protein